MSRGPRDRGGGRDWGWDWDETWDRTTRRQVVAGGIVVIMGIAWLLISLLPGRSEPAPTPTPTFIRRTTVPRETPIGEPVPPEILVVNLVSSWQEEGDVEENAIDEIEQGEPAVIAFRHRTWVHQGRQRLTFEVDAGRDTRNRTIDRLIDGTGPIVGESAVRFDTADWSTGSKVATVVVRDEITGFVSEPRSTQFDVL